MSLLQVCRASAARRFYLGSISASSPRWYPGVTASITSGFVPRMQPSENQNWVAGTRCLAPSSRSTTGAAVVGVAFPPRAGNLVVVSAHKRSGPAELMARLVPGQRRLFGVYRASPIPHYVWHHGYNKQGRGQRGQTGFLRKYALMTTLLPIIILLVGMQPDLQMRWMNYFRWGWTPPEADPSIIRDILRGVTPRASSDESYEREDEIRRRLYAENPSFVADREASYLTNGEVRMVAEQTAQ